MKPTIGKYKDARGRITGHYARIGPLEAQGNTPAQAIDRCNDAAVDALRRLELGTMIGVWNGHTYVVHPTINGFAYWIDVFSRRDYFVDSNATREHAIDRALLHLAQALWSHDVPDDRTFLDGLPYGIRAELGSWFQWQREYKRLADRGFNDSQTRAIIGGFVKETAIEPMNA